MSQYDARWLQVTESRYISLLAPPLLTKNINGRLVNDDNLYRDRDISREQNYSPGAIYLFSKKEFVREKSLVETN